MRFSYDFTVNSHACYGDGIARPTSLMTYMQEAANLQLRTYGPTNDDLGKIGLGFVLSRMSLQFYKPLYAYRSYTAESWAVESRGFSLFRCHRLLAGEEVCAEAVSVWAIIQRESKRPVRVSEYHANFEPDPMIEDFDVAPRIRLSRDRLAEVGEHRVVLSETDIYRHMNNTVYADMLANYADAEGRRLRCMHINYFSEAPLGDLLKIYRETGDDGALLFRTVREDGKTNVEASLTFTDI